MLKIIVAASTLVILPAGSVGFAQTGAAVSAAQGVQAGTHEKPADPPRRSTKRMHHKPTPQPDKR